MLEKDLEAKIEEEIGTPNFTYIFHKELYPEMGATVNPKDFTVTLTETKETLVFNLQDDVIKLLSSQSKMSKERSQAYQKADEFKYMLLSRLKEDCKYFLGFGGRSEKHLWLGNVVDQIAKMNELYNDLRIKPNWLSLEEIKEYENKMNGEENVTNN